MKKSKLIQTPKLSENSSNRIPWELLKRGNVKKASIILKGAEWEREIEGNIMKSCHIFTIKTNSMNLNEEIFLRHFNFVLIYLLWFHLNSYQWNQR